MNRAEQFWAQTVDELPPESDAAEGLGLALTAQKHGRCRAWYRAGVCTVVVHLEHMSLVARGRSLLEAVERLGAFDAF